MQKLLLVLLILACLTATYAAAKGKQHKSRKINIIAPERMKNGESLRPDSKMTFDCQEDMCNGTLRYPIQYLRKLITNSYPELSNFAGSALKPFDEPEVKGRGFNEDEEYMCPTKRHFMVPKVARNVKYELKFIVQTGNIIQPVQYDTCKKGSYCFARDFIPDNFATACKQHKVVVRLLTLHSNRTVSLDYFPIPGGCACTYFKV